MEGRKSYQKNPFVPKTKIGNKLTKLSNVDTDNAIEVDIVLAKESQYDKTPFTKVYNHDFDFLLKLTKPGLRLFCYIAKHLANFNKDSIYLYKEDFFDKMNELNEKGATDDGFKDGVNDLIKHKIIALSDKPLIYFINPNIFYRGERRYLLLIP